MKHLHDNHYVYIEPFRPPFPFLLVLGVVVVVIGLTADWLNGLPVQFVGPVLYPIERLLNAAFFPDAQTPLRPNGSALLVLLPTVALFAAIYFGARAMFRTASAFSGLSSGVADARAALVESGGWARLAARARRRRNPSRRTRSDGARSPIPIFASAWRSEVIRFDLARSSRRE